MRLAIGGGLALLLAGCGGGSGTANTSAATTPGASNAALPNPLAASGGSNDCAKNPDFAPVYAGGTIVVCSSSHFDDTGKDAGGFSYTTDATPAAVIAFTKESAAKSGLKQRLATDTMISAGEDGKRTLMVIAAPEGSGSRVQVNWSVVR